MDEFGNGGEAPCVEPVDDSEEIGAGSSRRCWEIGWTMEGKVCATFVRRRGRNRLLPPRSVQISEKK